MSIRFLAAIPLAAFLTSAAIAAGSPADYNGDGKISREEFRNEAAKAAFGADKNKNGFVDEEEFKMNDDQRKARAYPMQPPLIPHQTDNYQVDLAFNKCMSCHGRDRAAESQAPMVSVTHYQDREGTMRNEISPRRYFCTQCHVVQTDAKVPVKNDFRDFYSVSGKAGKGPGR